MEVIRYDRATLKAKRTDEGYLVDTPIVGRVGIQVYHNADGTTRRELRRPEEVFHADSLASFAGKPITEGHRGFITAANAKKVSVGVIKGDGQADGDNIRAPIVILDADAIDKAENGGIRELSLGYKVDLDETPGIWNGENYDAEQKNIRVNHLAIVPKGRAGNARLNLDRFDAASFTNDEETPMSDTLSRVRLDSGLEYQAAPEVVVALDKLRSDHAASVVHNDELQKQIDIVAAERDAFKSQVETADKVRADALESARKEIVARVALEKVADEFKVDHADKSDRDVREAVIKATRADADLTGKSDDYVNAAFDIAVSMRADAAMAEQRKATTGKREDGAAPKSSKELHAAYMANLGKKD